MSSITGKRGYPAEFEADTPPTKSLRTIEKENPGYTMAQLLRLPSPPSEPPSLHSRISPISHDRDIAKSETPALTTLSTLERENPSYTMAQVLCLPSPPTALSPSSSQSPFTPISFFSETPEDDSSSAADFETSFPLLSPSFSNVPSPISTPFDQTLSEESEMIELENLNSLLSGEGLSLISSISALADKTVDEMSQAKEENDILYREELGLLVRDLFQGAASEGLATLDLDENFDIWNELPSLPEMSGVELNPPSEPDTNRPKERFEKGVRLYKEGKFSKAAQNLLLAIVEGYKPAIQFVLDKKGILNNFPAHLLKPLFKEYIETPRSVELLRKMLPIFNGGDEFYARIRHHIQKQMIERMDDPVQKRDLLFDLGSKIYTGAIDGKRYSLKYIEESAKLGHSIALEWMIDTYSVKDPARYTWLRIAADTPDYSEGPNLPAFEMAQAHESGICIEKDAERALKYYLIFTKSIEKSLRKPFYLKNHFQTALRKIESMTEGPLKEEWGDSLTALRAYTAKKPRARKKKNITFS